MTIRAIKPMLSSEGKGKSTDSKVINQPIQLSANLHQEELEQIFYLLENLLSFEACLYHQILPLGLEGDKLLIGMVNPEDDVAQNYVNRILSYVKYKSINKLITAESHREILSAYLNYKNTSKLPTKSSAPKYPAENLQKDVESSVKKPNSHQPSQQTVVKLFLVVLADYILKGYLIRGEFSGVRVEFYNRF
jgi:hypothetical protein